MTDSLYLYWKAEQQMKSIKRNERHIQMWYECINAYVFSERERERERKREQNKFVCTFICKYQQT